MVVLAAIPSDYDGAMTYEATVKARSWPAYLMASVISLIATWLAFLHSPIWALFCAPFLAWAWWCMFTRREWRTRVGNGLVIWQPLILGRERTVAATDIARIEFESDHEGGHYLYLRMKNGKRRRFDVPERTGDFIAAILHENPRVEVDRFVTGMPP